MIAKSNATTNMQNNVYNHHYHFQNYNHNNRIDIRHAIGSVSTTKNKNDCLNTPLRPEKHVRDMKKNHVLALEDIFTMQNMRRIGVSQKYENPGSAIFMAIKLRHMAM